MGRLAHLTPEYLQREYADKRRSSYDIAEQHHTYPNRILRLLRRFGIPRRDKDEAQKQALASGRHKHPTKGTHRPHSVRMKISEKMTKAWEGVSPEEKQERVERGKAQWRAMPDEERRSLQAKATAAILRAAKEGSKLERVLVAELEKRGHNVIHHHEKFFGSESMHVDLFLPQEKVAIEVDGPSHFWPVWGEEKLAERIAADAHKTGLLLSNGFRVIRIKYLAKTLSLARARDVLYEVLGAISEDEKFIEIEVN